mgnify:CR=1 FL=1
MNILEILLIIVGAIVFIISFLIPMGKKKEDSNAGKINEDQIRALVGKEIETSKYRINEIIDETITYGIEKTERSMERLTNEKMMAVNEYSDTVLTEINKNHKEVIFLYDMLNDKHDKLKDAVSEATKTATEIKQTVKDAEITAKEAEEVTKKTIRTIEEQTTDDFSFMNLERVSADSNNILAFKETTGIERTNEAVLVNDDISEEQSGIKNNNERILELHEAGKSDMAIAKELGLGIGEVKLVIDLFEGL